MTVKAKAKTPRKTPRKAVKKKKATKKRTRPVGRPKFVIDMVASEKLAMLSCTQSEIASFLGCSVDTLQKSREFNGIYKKGKEIGCISVRRLQMRAAEKGDTTMLIWLGKQLLKQSNEPVDMDEAKVTEPIRIILAHDHKPDVYKRADHVIKAQDDTDYDD